MYFALSVNPFSCQLLLSCIFVTTYYIMSDLFVCTKKKYNGIQSPYIWLFIYYMIQMLRLMWSEGLTSGSLFNSVFDMGFETGLHGICMENLRRNRLQKPSLQAHTNANNHNHKHEEKLVITDWSACMWCVSPGPCNRCCRTFCLLLWYTAGSS